MMRILVFVAYLLLVSRPGGIDMRNPIRVALVLAIMACALPAVAADFDWGVRGGLYLDPTDFFLGVEALTPISGNFFFNPNIEHVFSDDSFTSVNADVHYDFGRRGRHFMWAGAGLALILDNDTDVGANLLAGVGRRWGTLIPYAQAKVVLADDTKVAIGGGIRF
jgi:hypothetical protein